MILLHAIFSVFSLSSQLNSCAFRMRPCAAGSLADVREPGPFWQRGVSTFFVFFIQFLGGD
jgi:hypothetical protein